MALAPPISEGQQAELRRVENARMRETCTLISRQRTGDGALGSTLTETQTDNVPCYVQPQRAGITETQFGGRLVSGLNWLFVFSYGTVISVDDEIIYQEQHFSVMGVLGPRSFETARRVVAVKK